jgi:hypothetical protein
MKNISWEGFENALRAEMPCAEREERRNRMLTDARTKVSILRAREEKSPGVQDELAALERFISENE